VGRRGRKWRGGILTEEGRGGKENLSEPNVPSRWGSSDT
jgi:hypothetical protein